MGKESSRLGTTGLLLLSLCACAPTTRPAPDLPSPDPARLLNCIEEKKNSVTSFKGIGRLSLVLKGEKQTARLAWIGSSQPERLRVETLGVWGQPDLTFLINRDKLCLYAHQEQRCVKGKATPRNLSHLLSIPLRAEDLFALFSGQVPVVSFDSVKLGYSAIQNSWCLYLYKKWRRLVERMWLEDGVERVKQLEVYDGWGHPQYSIAFDQFQDIDGTIIPQSIIGSGKHGMVFSLRIERFWIGVEIPDEAYVPQFSCAKVTRLDS